jgi:hypothetical protein
MIQHCDELLLCMWCRLVGLNTSREAIASALVHETLCISSKEWSLTQALARVSGGMTKFLAGDRKAQEGETSELRGAKVSCTTAVLFIF